MRNFFGLWSSNLFRFVFSSYSCVIYRFFRPRYSVFSQFRLFSVFLVVHVWSFLAVRVSVRKPLISLSLGHVLSLFAFFVLSSAICRLFSVILIVNDPSKLFVIRFSAVYRDPSISPHVLVSFAIRRFRSLCASASVIRRFFSFLICNSSVFS